MTKDTMTFPYTFNFMINNYLDTKFYDTHSPYACEFRGKPDTESDSYRTVIPIQFGHRFRFISDSDSGLKSDTFRLVSERCPN